MPSITKVSKEQKIRTRLSLIKKMSSSKMKHSKKQKKRKKNKMKMMLKTDIQVIIINKHT